MAIPYVLFSRGLRPSALPEASLLALIEPILNPVWVVLFVGETPRRPRVIGGLFLWRAWRSVRALACRKI